MSCCPLTLTFPGPEAPLQALYLEVAPVVGINQEVNLTAVLLPLNPNLTVFYWWIGHSLQVSCPWPCGPVPAGYPLGCRAGPCLGIRQQGTMWDSLPNPSALPGHCEGPT